MNKKIAWVLLLGFSFYVSALVFHHHQDGLAHDACALCFSISHHASVILGSVFQVSAPSFVLPLIFIEKSLDISLSFRGLHSNRAPPFV
jgi:hypothetical protein